MSSNPETDATFYTLMDQLMQRGPETVTELELLALGRAIEFDVCFGTNDRMDDDGKLYRGFYPDSDDSDYVADESCTTTSLTGAHDTDSVGPGNPPAADAPDDK